MKLDVKPWAALLALPIIASACGGGGGQPGSGPLPTITSKPTTTTPTSAAGVVNVNPSAISFTDPTSQTANVSEFNYSGAFAASTKDCAGIASISSTSGTTFSVSPQAGGTCSFQFADAKDNLGNLAIGNTTANIITKSKRR